MSPIPKSANGILVAKNEAFKNILCNLSYKRGLLVRFAGFVISTRTFVSPKVAFNLLKSGYRNLLFYHFLLFFFSD